MLSGQQCGYSSKQTPSSPSVLLAQQTTSRSCAKPSDSQQTGYPAGAQPAPVLLAGSQHTLPFGHVTVRLPTVTHRCGFFVFFFRFFFRAAVSLAANGARPMPPASRAKTPRRVAPRPNRCTSASNRSPSMATPSLWAPSPTGPGREVGSDAPARGRRTAGLSAVGARRIPDRGGFWPTQQGGTAGA